MSRTVGSRNKNQSETKEGLLLGVIGFCGEVRSRNVKDIVSGSYGRELVSKLRREGLIKDWGSGDLKTIRLTEKGKDVLLERNPCREFPRIRSEVIKRKADLSISEVLIMMMRAGVSIYPEEKPDIFGHGPPPLADGSVPSQTGLGSVNQNGVVSPTNVASSLKTIPAPLFYTSKEYKQGAWRGMDEHGKSQTSISSSCRGLMLIQEMVYAVYNTSDSEVGWDVKTELHIKAEIQNNLCRVLLPQLYHRLTTEGIHGIMLGRSMESLERYLVDMRKGESATKFLTGTYNPFYYVAKDKCGVVQMRLLTRPDRYLFLLDGVKAKYEPVGNRYSMECDALTKEGAPVLFSMLLSIPQLIRFKEGLEYTGKKGLVWCIEEQREMLSRYFGGLAEVKGIERRKIVENFLDGK